MRVEARNANRSQLPSFWGEVMSQAESRESGHIDTKLDSVILIQCFAMYQFLCESCIITSFNGRNNLTGEMLSSTMFYRM